MSQASIVFEHPHVGGDVVSQASPSGAGVNGPTPGPDSDVCSCDGSDGDAEDYWSDDGFNDNDVFEQPELDWHPHAINFLAQVPPSDASWSRYLRTNRDVHTLRSQLRVPFLHLCFGGQFDWAIFFGQCSWYLYEARMDPPLASLFSLIFLAACHVALVDGCDHDLVFEAIRQCVRQCGIWEFELTMPMLGRLRMGAIKGIMLLAEYSRVVGSRAHELPLHSKFPPAAGFFNTSLSGRTAPNCMQLFMRCTPACMAYVKRHIPSTYRPTTHLRSDCLETTYLVYSLLGGSSSKWEYRDICQILQPEVPPMPLYKDICIEDVMVYDEIDDEGVSGFVGHVSTFKCEFACAFQNPWCAIKGKGLESF